MEAIEARGLTKYYSQFAAVKELSLTVHPGEIYGFLGENGAGKSTTIRVLLGLIWPDAGEVYINGKRIVPGSGQALVGVGAIVDQPFFYNSLSAEQNLRLIAQLSGGATDAQVSEAMDLLGLESMKHKAAGILSHGQKQRLGIAQALLPDNRLLILDEPQNGLDPHWIRKTRQLLALLRSRGVTVLISSHRLNEIEQVCDRVAIIHQGEKLYEGHVAPLLSATEYVTVFSSRSEEASRCLREKGLAIRDGKPNAIEVHAPTDKEAAEINRLLVNQGFDVSEISRVHLTLEDVFLDLTKGGEAEA